MYITLLDLYIIYIYLYNIITISTTGGSNTVAAMGNMSFSNLSSGSFTPSQSFNTFPRQIPC